MKTLIILIIGFFFAMTSESFAIEEVTLTEDGRGTHIEISTSPIVLIARGNVFSRFGSLAEAHADAVIYPQTFGPLEFRPIVQISHIIGTESYLSESFVRSGIETSLKLSDNLHFGATINHTIDFKRRYNDVVYDIGGIFVWGDNATFRLGFGGAKRSGGALLLRFRYLF